MKLVLAKILYTKRDIQNDIKSLSLTEQEKLKQS
jgi:hypothetical protein